MARTTSWSSGSPDPTACERRRFSWSRSASAGAMRTLASSPMPVVTP